MRARPKFHEDPAAVADQIIAETGGDIVLGLPLGLGKANHVANALFERAEADRSIRLHIVTALTLEAPSAGSELERRFLEPLNQRLFAGYPALAYAEALRGDGLPPNIHVTEFFFQAGRWLGNAAAQQSYTSANYTHAVRYMLDSGVNVIAQLVAPDDGGTDRYSLSCNPDITLDLLDVLRFRGGSCLMVGQVNSELPFMPGPAALPAEAFDHVLTGSDVDFPLFGPPDMPVSEADHAIGIRAAALVPDGGSIQIGIGSIGDAFGSALLMRHQAPDVFRETLKRLGGPEPQLRNTEPFEQGLYGISEMFVPALLALYRGGVLKREAADGALLHSAFFVGPRGFYRSLREMGQDERAQFQMREISFVNQLYGDEAAKRRDRTGGRFVNNAMIATALGAVVSDAIEDGRVVSGVGGQYNFVAQAFALDDARAIITLQATRDHRGKVTSNIVWSYGHTTIPRHLRDIVVTEYGVADLRGRSDRDCAAAMIAIADSRFQDTLVKAAKRAGKLERPFSLPEHGRGNKPDMISEALAPARAAGWCGAFPFGTDLIEEEQKLLPALARLKTLVADPRQWAAMAARTVMQQRPDPQELRMLRRLGLADPSRLKERMYRNLVLSALRHRDR